MRQRQKLLVFLVFSAALFLSWLPGEAAFAADPAPRSPSDEEFVGPFASWRDARKDYGAIGDGKADDTAALQRALNDLVKHEKACVLYLPAGKYRLTATLQTVRKAHTDSQGVAIIGENPAVTTFLWDGPEGGVMFEWDAWYSKISRLTFDGAGRAGTALLYGPAFSTYNETSDLIFRDAKAGLVFGGPQTHGQAENEVLRCQFIRCETGLQTVNWNSMDIWVWYCRFEDCGRGVHNVMGNWHVWQSIFLRSRVADLSTINLMAFSAVNNTSIGSRRFFDFSTGHTWGSPVSLTGNRVLDPTGDWAVILDNAGPYLVADNMMRLSGRTRGVRMTWGDPTLAGNTYTKTNAVEERGRFRRIAEKIVPASEISDLLPALPPTPSRRSRQIFEVAAGANGEAIQQAIGEAAKLAGQRPVVHLPMGHYTIDKTLIIPRGSDLQLIGDGAGETGSRLNWAGAAEGVVLRLEGPSRATLRDFYIHAGQARALVVEDVDEPGGRIFTDQLNANGPSGKVTARSAAVRVNGLDQTDLLLRALQGSGNSGAWVEVIGGPKAASAQNQVNIFTGATGSAAGQYDVRRGGRLVVRGVYHERSSGSLNGLHLTDRGMLSIDATRFSYATSQTAPTVAADNFQGLFTLATCILMPVETKESCRFELRGDGSGASVLALNNQFWIQQATTADDVWQNKAAPPARGGLVGCNVNTGNKSAAPKGFAFLPNIGEHSDPAKSKSGSGPLDDRGTVDDATILRHLAPLREARVWLPGPTTSAMALQMHRIMASGGHDAVVEFRARQGRTAMTTTVHSTAELRSAIAEATPGAQILIAPGTYEGGSYFRNVRGQPNEPIIIAGADPKAPPLFQGSGGGMHFSAVAYLELTDLSFTGAEVNGLNIDDSGKYTQPSHHVVLRRLTIRDIGKDGNHDGIKLSGVTDFRVEQCTIENWGSGGGSAVDMVGCHRGLITSNLFRHTDIQNSTGVQAKGGSSQITVQCNRFETAGGRGVNIGGSTGLNFFRPPLQPDAEHAEAKDIRVEGNTFVGGGTPVAYVGVDGAVVRFNTIYRPKRWALRILQETRAPGFVPCRNGQFTDNLVVFHSTDWAEGGVNIGPGTAPETFQFARNWWYCLDHPDKSQPKLPSPESNGTYGTQPPLRDPNAGDFRWNLEASGAAVGADAWRE